MKVADALARSAVAVGAEQTVHEAAVVMERAGVGSVVVLDGDRVVGIVTDRDLLRRVLVPRLPLDARIDSVMTIPVVSVDADADLHEALDLFGEHTVRRLPATRRGELVGVVTVDDLLVRLSSDLAALTRPVAAESEAPHHDSSLPVAG